MTDEQPQPQPKPFRPRDELGRPLPAGSEDRLGLPDFDANSLEENHRLAIEYLEAGNSFAAHEAWETCWGQAKGTEEEEFFKGLAQLGAGYTHYQRGNAHGAHALLTRALERIGSRGSPYRGIDVQAFASAVEETRRAAAQAEHAGAKLPPLPATGVPRAPD
jgi:predicted metal-dependent hydrolase